MNRESIFFNIRNDGYVEIYKGIIGFGLDNEYDYEVRHRTNKQLITFEEFGQIMGEDFQKRLEEKINPDIWFR
ncbi:MAG: hypothetical protein AABY22_22815 [Nanoarchaeota archaeon]